MHGDGTRRQREAAGSAEDTMWHLAPRKLPATGVERAVCPCGLPAAGSGIGYTKVAGASQAVEVGLHASPPALCASAGD